MSPTLAPRRGSRRNAAVAVTGQALARGSNFLLTVAAARVLSGDQFGTLSLVLVLNALVLAVGSFGLDTFLLREMTAAVAYLPDAVGWVLRSKAILAVVAIGPSLIYLAVVVERGDLLFGALAVTAATWATLAETYETVMAHDREYGIRAAVMAAPNLLLTVTAVLCLLFVGTVPWAYGLLCTVVLASAIVRFAIGRTYVRRRHGRVRSLHATRPTTDRYLARAAPFAGIAVLGFLYAKVDAFIIVAIDGTVDFGQYAAGYALYLGLIMLMAAIGPLILQRSYQIRADSRALRRDVFRAGVLGGAIAAVVALVAPFVVAVAYGDGFDRSTVVLRILMVALPLNYANSIALRQCLASGQERWVNGVLLIALLFSASANVVMVSKYGIEGAAWVTVLTEGILLVGLGTMARHRTRAMSSTGGDPAVLR